MTLLFTMQKTLVNFSLTLMIFKHRRVLILQNFRETRKDKKNKLFDYFNAQEPNFQH